MGAFTDLLYMVLSLGALIHTWATLSGDERRKTGFNRILWGFAIAFGPILLFGLAGVALPGLAAPGSDLLPLLGAAIPGSMALAVRARSRRFEPG